MSVADKIGLGPTREVIDHPAKPGYKIIRVTPNPIFGSEGKGDPRLVTLNPEQFNRYQLWQNGTVLIQDALYDLMPSQRETLMTGL